MPKRILEIQYSFLCNKNFSHSQVFHILKYSFILKINRNIEGCNDSTINLLTKDIVKNVTHREWIIYTI